MVDTRRDPFCMAAIFSSHVPLENWCTVDTFAASAEAMRVERVERYFILAVNSTVGG